MHKQNARSRLFCEQVSSKLLTPSLRGYPPRARAGRNRVCGMRIHRDPQRVTHAHCIGTRKATINAQHSVVPTLGHRTHQTLCGNRKITVVMLKELVPLSFGQPNTIGACVDHAFIAASDQTQNAPDTIWLLRFTAVRPGDRNRTQNLEISCPALHTQCSVRPKTRCRRYAYHQ